MRNPHRAFAIAALGAALMLTGRPALATPPPAVPAPRLVAGGPVRAGDEAEIRWAATDARVEELELLLSLDGGRSWHVRVSPSLSGEHTSWRWRVPNLPSAEARIRIRARVDGREIEGAMSGRFAILGDPERPLTRAVFSEGAWWTGFELPLGPAGGFARRDEESLTATRASLTAEDAPRVVAPMPGPAAPASLDAPRAIALPASTRARNATPEGYPLRN